jgi:hypothetical protein
MDRAERFDPSRATCTLRPFLMNKLRHFSINYKLQYSSQQRRAPQMSEVSQTKTNLHAAISYRAPSCTLSPRAACRQREINSSGAHRQIRCTTEVNPSPYTALFFFSLAENLNTKFITECVALSRIKSRRLFILSHTQGRPDSSKLPTE